MGGQPLNMFIQDKLSGKATALSDTPCISDLLDAAVRASTRQIPQSGNCNMPFLGAKVISAAALARSVREAPASTEDLITYIGHRYHDSLREDVVELSCLAIESTRSPHDESPPPRGSVEVLLGINVALFDQLQQDEQVIFPLMLSATPPRMSDLLAGAMAKDYALLERVEEFQDLTGGFKAPATASPAWRALCFGAREFAEDLVAHLYLKHMVLFPRFV